MNGLISLMSTLTLVTSAPLSLTNSNFTTYHNSQEHKPILVGYWHNWDNGAGYQGGTAKYIDLVDVNQEYYFINVSFMKSYMKFQLLFQKYHINRTLRKMKKMIILLIKFN